MTTMPSNENKPQFQGRPVIMVHLVTDIDPDIAWCTPIMYTPASNDSYPTIPRVMCPACARAGM